MIARITRNNLQYHFVFYALFKKQVFLLEGNLEFVQSPPILKAENDKMTTILIFKGIWKK